MLQIYLLRSVFLKMLAIFPTITKKLSSTLRQKQLISGHLMHFCHSMSFNTHHILTKVSGMACNSRLCWAFSCSLIFVLWYFRNESEGKMMNIKTEIYEMESKKKIPLQKSVLCLWWNYLYCCNSKWYELLFSVSMTEILSILMALNNNKKAGHNEWVTF